MAKNWPKPTLVKDIQVFISFIIFYCCFIQNLNKITALLISPLKPTRSSDLISKAFRVNQNKVVRVDSRANETVVNLSKNNKCKNLTYLPNIRAIRETIFLIYKAKKAFNHLK